MQSKVWKAIAVILLLSAALISCAGKKKEALQGQAEASINLGEAYMNQGNFTAALREFLKAEKLHSEDSYLHNNLGIVYMAKGKLDIAIEHFKRSLELDPSYSQARNNLGTTYLVKEEWDAAIETFEQVAEDILYPTPHYPLTNMGFAYYNKGEYEKSEKYYKEALDLRPDFVIALKGLARTYITMARYAEAINKLDAAIQKSPKNPSLHLDLGKAYLKINNRLKAVESFKTAIALAPDSEIATEAEKEILQVRNQR